MIFIHQDPAFRQLLTPVTRDLDLSPEEAERSYWVDHVLWGLQGAGLDLCLRGETSIRKGFGLIDDFSDAIHIGILDGQTVLPCVNDWSSPEPAAVRERIAFFQAVANLSIPEVKFQAEEMELDEGGNWASITATFPHSRRKKALPGGRTTLEITIGHGRKAPLVNQELRSEVHQVLGTKGKPGRYIQNRLSSIPCVHPLVTLIEKLDLISDAFQAERDPAEYAHHYIHVMRILQKEEALPPLAQGHDLVRTMYREGWIRRMPFAEDPAFNPSNESPWPEIRRAVSSVAEMLWAGPNEVGLITASIRVWCEKNSSRS